MAKAKQEEERLTLPPFDPEAAPTVPVPGESYGLGTSSSEDQEARDERLQEIEDANEAAAQADHEVAKKRQEDAEAAAKEAEATSTASSSSLTETPAAS